MAAGQPSRKLFSQALTGSLHAASRARKGGYIYNSDGGDCARLPVPRNKPAEPLTKASCAATPTSRLHDYSEDRDAR